MFEDVNFFFKSLLQDVVLEQLGWYSIKVGEVWVVKE